MAGKETWTPEQTARLVALWPDNSASIIGAEIGMTRDAVIGKAWRLGLPNKLKNENVRELVPMHKKPPVSVTRVTVQPTQKHNLGRPTPQH